MDLRIVAFNLIARDTTLRTLLANYARQLGGDGASDQAEPRFVALRWAADQRAQAPAGSELLTVQVHVPPDDACPPEHLDAVLRRLAAALTAAGPAPCITVRCLGTSGTSVDSRFGTLVKSSTWRVAPVPVEPERAAAVRLVPWRVWGGSGSAGHLVPGVGALSLN